VAILHRRPTSLRAVIFDLDEALLDRSKAWAYTVEEAVASVTGRRIDAAPLAIEYSNRPWRHALGIVLSDPDELEAAASLCGDMYARSALKRLLVQEGAGMALDALRGASVEIGAISREPHAIARRQVDSTGLDRFLAVLSPTPDREHWDPGARLAECRGFLEYEPPKCAFIAADARALEAGRDAGFMAFVAGWCGSAPGRTFPVLDQPSSVARLLE
jgi:beta-phosphoglucomutase-like phosphatase (HAD superfamily)